MTILETSIKISKPVEKVFEFITNLDNQKKLSSYITGVESSGPLQVGAKYKIETTSMGHKNVTTNEVVSFEPGRKFGVKTLAAPPASDVTNTYLVRDAVVPTNSPGYWSETNNAAANRFYRVRSAP